MSIMSSLHAMPVTYGANADRFLVGCKYQRSINRDSFNRSVSAQQYP